jgi:hypothetical protein
MDVFYTNPGPVSYVTTTTEGIYWDIPFNTTWHILMDSLSNNLGNMTIYLEIV